MARLERLLSGKSAGCNRMEGKGVKSGKDRGLIYGGRPGITARLTAKRSCVPIV